MEVLRTAAELPLPSDHGVLAAWEWPLARTPRELIESKNDDAPRVLLVHGWEGRGAQLGALVEPLTKAGFRVFAFDARGHGASPGDRSSLFDVAHAVEQAVRTLGPFHAIVAHSMGGASTLWASRNGPLAKRVVMLAPPVDLRDFTRMFADTVGLTEDVRQLVHGRLARRFGVPLEEAQAVPQAAKMHEPLLVIHDEDDREVPIACGEAIARAWPGAELVRTRGLGHRRILRDEAVIQRVVRFVTQSQAPAETADGA